MKCKYSLKFIAKAEGDFCFENGPLVLSLTYAHSSFLTSTFLFCQQYFYRGIYIFFKINHIRMSMLSIVKGRKKEDAVDKLFNPLLCCFCCCRKGQNEMLPIKFSDVGHHYHHPHGDRVYTRIQLIPICCWVNDPIID